MNHKKQISLDGHSFNISSIARHIYSVCLLLEKGKKSSDKSSSDISSVVWHICNICLLIEKGKKSSDKSSSDISSIARHIYSVCLLLEKGKKSSDKSSSDISSVVWHICNICLLIEKGKKSSDKSSSDISSIARHIYSVCLLLEKGKKSSDKSSSDISSVVWHICNICLFLKKKPSGKYSFHISSSIQHIYSICLLLEQQKKPSDKILSDISFIIRHIYSICLLLEQQKKPSDKILSDISSSIQQIYSICLLLEQQKKPSDKILSDISSSIQQIYSICLLLEKGEGPFFIGKSHQKRTIQPEDLSTGILSVLNSVYRLVFVLCKKSDEKNLLQLLRSIYKMAFTLKDSKRKQEEALLSLNFYIEGIIRIFKNKHFTSNEQIMADLEDAFSDGQLRSKLWLIQVLKEKNLSSLGTVFLCAGWYGALAFLLMTDTFFKLKHCFLFEKDLLSVQVSEDLNRFFVKKDWKFKASLKDILDLNYLTGQFQTLKADGTVQDMLCPPDTIINTACEHIERFDLWWFKIPTKKLLILQNNNYFDLPEHVNCVSSLQEFKKQVVGMDLVYEGVLDMKRYKRFLLIGYKSA